MERDKQNNIRISDFDDELITWDELCEEEAYFRTVILISDPAPCKEERGSQSV